jgi:hypothetical protein
VLFLPTCSIARAMKAFPDRHYVISTPGPTPLIISDYIWALFPRHSNKMLQMVKLEVLDPFVGVLLVFLEFFFFISVKS